MTTKQLVLAIFDSEADADTAAEALKTWDRATEDIKLKSVGVLVLDDEGKLKVDKVGPRSAGKGAGIGLILAMATPVGLVAGLAGGAILGRLHRKGLGISDQDRERIGDALNGRKAAVGVVAEASESDAISAKLLELGGTPETHDLDDEAVKAADDAAAAEPVAAEAEPEPVAAGSAPTA